LVKLEALWKRSQGFFYGKRKALTYARASRHTEANTPESVPTP